MGLQVFNDIDLLLNTLGEFICEVSKEAIQKRGQFDFVLSGGNSPKKLYELLASEKFKNRIDWCNTSFFFGDERFVPDNDFQRNSLMAQETLFEPLKIKESHIFKVDTNGSPKEAAYKYSESITTHFNNKRVEFDFILLGLGDNAHTASLFPNSSVLRDSEATIKAVFVKEVNMYRITMTAPLINQAKHIAFLVFGKDKTDAIYHILKDSKGTTEQYPARLIEKDENKVQWFLDRNSASRL